MAALNMPPEIHRASPAAGQPNMVDKLGEKSFSAMQGLVAEDRKLKEKDVNSFQSLMEYREAPASPSASSVTTTLSQDNCGSPRTPNSPPGRQDIQEMDDERLPNELLDELCEDIGMKEGMELDFVEFLMEQDMVDPQTYMTPEAARLSGFPTPTASQTNSALNTPTNKSSSDTPQWGNRNCGSPSYSIASSTNVTIATSSGSSSPVSKRFHLSNSGPSSPVRSNPPPLSHLGQTNHVFKAPQTPPTPRRPIPSSQGAASPRSNLSVCSNQSDHSSHSNISNHSNHSSVHSNQNSNQIPQRCASPKTAGGAPSPQLPHSTTGTYNKAPPQYGQFQGQGQTDPSRPSNSNNLQKAAIANNQPYQRFGRPVPPNVNVQNFQQNQKWMPGSQPQGTMGNQSCAVNSMQGQMPNSQCVRPTDSPLDQGYFTSSDSMSVRSFGSSAASSVPSNNTMQSANSQKQMPISSNSQVQQKSVHFADNMNMHNSTPTEGLPYEPLYRTNVPDCELEEYRNSMRRMQSKMMPRLNHHVKPDIGPYTVPNNNGQGTMNPYDFPSAHSNNVNMNSNHGNMNMNSPAPNMQQFDFPHKNNDSFMDNNQNMVMYNENMQSSQGQVNNMNCQMPSSCNGPVGMQQMDPYNRGNNPCQVPDPSKGGMYDPAGMCKTNNQPLQTEGGNCQFSGQTQGNHSNMNNGMMGMNQGMLGNQGEVNQNFNSGQNYQGMPNSQDFSQQNMMAGNGDRTMHMNMPSAQGNNRMMGYNEFEPNRAMSGNMNNMNSMDNVYPPNQGQGMGDNMNWNGGMPPQQPHQMGTTPRSAAMGMPGQGVQMGGGQCGQLTGQQCMIPNCVNCKSGSPQRPPMMTSQQRFIQHLVSDGGSNAFRSHPLFPLLRDMIIADMHLNEPNFPYHHILNLPEDFNKLLQNFLHRNPAAGNYQTNFAVESVIMDALKYAHQCLIGKLRQKQEQDADKHSKSTSKSLSAIEEFCEKFDQSVRKTYIKPATLQINGNPGQQGMGGPQMGPMVPPEMGTPTKVGMGMASMMMPGAGYGSPMAKKGLEFHNMMSPSFKQFVDIDSASDCGSIVSSSSHCNKPESKKHPSLPKEAVAMMLDWLRQHKDNPYPNDDEKAMLIKQTGLTINQINYWFTNARRRILPKWAQQCK